MAKKTIPIRSDPMFHKMLNEIKLDRVRTGQNKILLSDRRLTLAMTRVPGLKDFILKSKIEDDKK